MDGRLNCPDVRSYLDASQFLRDFYAYKKKCDPKFSYDLWAKEMGLQSKSYLRFAVLGQRGISSVLTQRLSKYLNFDLIASEYFSILVLYSQCPDADQKALLGRRLTQLLRQDWPLVEDVIPTSVMASPMAITIRNILSYVDIPRTENFLSQLLGIELAEVESLLLLLQKENLVERRDDEWIATHESIRVTDKTRGETLQYHKRSLLRAIDCQSLPVETRHFRSVGLAMTEDEYKTYLDELDQFVRKTFSRYDSNHLREKRVYQMNFNLVPWTTKVSENGEAN